MPPPSDPIVGIDLGTTNSLVAIAGPGGPRVLGDDPLLPSAVRYEHDPDSPTTLRAIVGRDALDRAPEFPLRTITSVKRLMGRSLDDARPDLPYLPYRVVEGDQHTARIAIPTPDESANTRVISPQEVSADILRALKFRAELALGVPVRRAVVTVPAYFDDAQRQATRDAARLAGLDAVRILNEPTAAALAYGLGLPARARPLTVVVFDLGGGTFDATALRITPAPDDSDTPAFFQVLATAGDTRLGGDDVDLSLARALATRLPAPHAGALESLTPSSRRALLHAARALKHALSDASEASIRIELGPGLPIDVRADRAELEAMMTPWLDRAFTCCARMLKDTSLTPGNIDAVVLVGGSTRAPLVRRRAAAFFAREPYTSLDPDRVVALGAAVQASILSGGTRHALLLDVIPLSLGIETAGGAFAKLILRNSTVPARATEMFTTSVDGQTSIKLNVLQGEREMAEHCRSLGTFHLRGLPPMPAGVPQVEVEFLVDAGGVLGVSAVERRTGRRASLQVIPNHGLTRDEVDRIEAESYVHARGDMARHRVADLVVNARLDLKWIDESLSRHGQDLDPSARAELHSRADELRSLLVGAEADWRGVDPDELHRAKDALDRASLRLQELAILRSLGGGR